MYEFRQTDSVYRKYMLEKTLCLAVAVKHIHHDDGWKSAVQSQEGQQQNTTPATPVCVNLPILSSLIIMLTIITWNQANRC